MKKNCTRKFKALFVALLASIPMLVGCGDSAHNDQGMSFTALGWYSGGPEIENDFEILEDGTIVVTDMGYTYDLGDAVLSISAALSGVVGDDYAIPARVGLQNNMAYQYIRTERMYHEYYIPGAKVQPPSTSVSFNLTLGSSSENEEGLGYGSTSSLPSGFETLPNEAYPNVIAVTPEVRSFINMNLDKMPEPPFVMLVTSYVEGVTGSGKRIKTNPIMLDVYWTPATEIQP